MSTDPASPAPPQPVVIPEDVPRVYANYIALLPGGMDVTIGFGHQVSANPPQWSVQATMSWEEARFLISVLQGAIDSHEQTFGPVRDVMKVAQETLAKLQQQPGSDSEGADEDA